MCQEESRGWEHQQATGKAPSAKVDGGAAAAVGHAVVDRVWSSPATWRLLSLLISSVFLTFFSSYFWRAKISWKFWGLRVFLHGRGHERKVAGLCCLAAKWPPWLLSVLAYASACYHKQLLRFYCLEVRTHTHASTDTYADSGSSRGRVMASETFSSESFRIDLNALVHVCA